MKLILETYLNYCLFLVYELDNGNQIHVSSKQLTKTQLQKEAELIFKNHK